MLDAALEWLRDIRDEPLKPVTLGKLAASLGAIAGVVLLELSSQDGWVPILDSLNLVFHEAGHPLFAIFGETVGFLGGTFGQLLVPLIVLAACWQRREAAAIGLSGAWFFQNFLNIARYMADARAQLLPLVGGGEHDWATLFGQWGLLGKVTLIADVTRALGWLGIGACVGWILWRVQQDWRNSRS